MDRHDTLLISSSSPENRRRLRFALGQRYNLLEALNTSQTMLLLKQNMGCIAAVLLDISQTETLDTGLLTRQENVDHLEQIPVIVLSRDDAPDTLNLAFSYGAADVIPLDYDPYAMLRRIETIVQLHLHRQHLQALVEAQASSLRRSNEAAVDALSSIIEYRSLESGQHILRIRHFTKLLLEEVARCCPEYGLTDGDIAIISSASALHDIGKIAIPDAILMKPGPLTHEEWEIMKTHAATGCRILDSLGDTADPEYLRYANSICRWHHERWDGGGYPDGLAGEQIPICAQVVGLADAYDALTSKRAYKDAYPFDRAVNMILQGECGAFSPKLLECFKQVTGRYEALARDYADGRSPRTEAFEAPRPSPAVQQENDSLERTRAKYFALVHHIGGFLMELDINQGLFHLIYNPYPELTRFENASTFSDLERIILEQVVVPEERQRMARFLHQDIGKFLEEDLRRVRFHFRFRSRTSREGDLFEVTLLRINPIDPERRSLAVLCRRMEPGEIPAAGIRTDLLTECTYCCRNDRSFTLVEPGSEIDSLAGYTIGEIRELFDGALIRLIHPEDRERVRREVSTQLQRGTRAELDYRLLCRDGSVQWMVHKSRLVAEEDGQEYLYTFLTDISHTRQSNNALRDRLRRYEIILAQTENVLFEWDIQQDAITFSDTWEKIFGFSPVTGQVRTALKNGSYFHPDDLPALSQRVHNLEKGSDYEVAEVRIATARGRYLWCRFRASAIRDEDGSLTKVVGIIINIDAEKQAEKILQDRAERDSLTKLLNKRAAEKHGEEYLKRFPQGAGCAMLLIDVDDFKQINDRYGHLFGDTVLTRAAREIERLFRSQDIVARVGGDEFLVLMRGVCDRKLLESRCRQLLSIFGSAFREQQEELRVSCSIGIALSPEHGTTYFDLYSRADQALYRAKAMGKNGFRFYDAQM